MTSRTVEQLKSMYTESKWQSRYVDICDLIEILADCTIADNYTVSDELNAAIKLTDAGNSILNKLTMRQKVNAKDARLLCALHLGHEELFIDVDATDIEKLTDAINKELKKRTIRFPFIYGRNLYDAYADLFDEEKDLLTNEETLKLLDKLPDGVFQYGTFTVGPYGVRRGLSARNIQSKRRVLAYHCSKVTCQNVHPVLLQTGYGAAIHRHREKLDTVLASHNEPSEWWALAAELSGLSSSRFLDQRAGVLLPLIGDTLSDTELQSLVVDLLDKGTQGALRKAVSDFLTVRSADQAVALMDRAQLLQLTLIAPEESVASTLDRLVHNETIRVPRNDVRRPVINRNVRSGAFRLHAELGHYGVRFVSDDPGLALLRERRLLNELYLREPGTGAQPGTDVQELEWQLRGVDTEDLDEKLEHFFQTRTPAEALERLVLARKTNMITACHEVGIDHDHGMGDRELIEALLWKLGFPTDIGDDPHASFWQYHERLWALTQSSAIGSSERFRETAAPYFTELEGLLLDSLAFTSWALLVDHADTAVPFTYDDYEDRKTGLSLLQAAYLRTSSGTDPHPFDFTSEKRVDLRTLMEGFRVLARHLRNCREDSGNFLRPTTQLPSFDGKTKLKIYALRSTIPFLDLSCPSQDRIIDGLDFVTDTMVAADVNMVRNDYLHYRRTPPDISRVEEALEATRQGIAKIENLGFCRLPFVPSAVSVDRWGQSKHEFVGPRSYEHIFVRPTQLDWMGLPELETPLYLLRSASFGDPNEVLRFTGRYPSEFSEMWSGFPNRRRRRPGSPIGEEPADQAEEIEVSQG